MMKITNLTKTLAERSSAGPRKTAGFSRELKFNAELADNIFLQAKGLSFSSRKRNMLFRFKLLNRWTFWMFGMSYDIWIAFIDDKHRVFQLEKGIKMTLNPATWRVYKPSKACRYVLETTDKIVNLGDRLKF